MQFFPGLSRRGTLAGGQPIGNLMHSALANPQLISLAAGFVDPATLPCQRVQSALQRLVQTPQRLQTALQYGTTEGLPWLRELICQRLESRYGEAPPSIDRVMLTAGSNQLLFLLCEALLDPDDQALCTAPTYLVFLGIVANVGAQSVGIATDAEGMCPEALEAELQQASLENRLQRIKMIYLVQYFDNPRGLTTSPQRVAEIVRIAKKWSQHHRIHVITDVAYRKLRYDGEDTPSMRSYDDEQDTVIVAGTFSKSLSPGLRVGWGVLPQHLVGPLTDLKGNMDFGSPCFNQFLVAELLDSGDYDRHVEVLRESYLRKRDVMLGALEEAFSEHDGVRWIAPHGGLYVWLELPPEMDSGSQGPLFDAAIQEGVIYVPGEYFFPHHGQPRKKNFIRLSFGVQSLEGICRGVQALSQAIHKCLALQTATAVRK